MQIEVQEQVQVEAEANTVSTSPDNNANAVVIKGKDLNALSDDPDELQSELEALAGPSAGPNGGQIYIDGFTGGQLPPKSSIREIRVNQNPFSAEYDRLGYGRIEIFTKPGTGSLHGNFQAQGNDSAFNSQNPLLTGVSEPPYYSWSLHGSAGGPITKTSSYFVSAFSRNQQNENIVEAINPASITAAKDLERNLPNQRSVRQSHLAARYQSARRSATRQGEHAHHPRNIQPVGKHQQHWQHRAHSAGACHQQHRPGKRSTGFRQLGAEQEPGR